MIDALLEEVVAPCAECTPEGRCTACKGEALDYYVAAVNAMDFEKFIAAISNEAGSDLGGYRQRDLVKVAEQVKERLLQNPPQPTPTREQVMQAVAPVLFNAGNYPRLGGSINPFAGKIADAVLALLTGGTQ